MGGASAPKFGLTRRWIIPSAGLLVLALAVFLLQRPPLLEDVSFSRAVFDRHGTMLRLTLAQDEQYRLYTPLDAISPQLREAVLLHEDQHFYTHPGINPVALGRAAFSIISGGRRIGASTITMQLARIKHRINSRSPIGKIWQMLCALRLELHYSKDQVLEAYLNLASYGYNIEGIGAASLIYFHAKPSALTLPQALTLAVMPQSPARRRLEPQQPEKPALIGARNRLFSRWLEEHPAALAQQIFFRLPLASYGRRDLPDIAPHLTRDLLHRFPQVPQLTATLDSELQQRLAVILGNYVRDKREVGINNASALLVNTQTMHVLASIGSADFHNAAINGQVDGTRAKRSPGSTLKPFIYARAFDQGLVHPATILADTPSGFGSYQPDNFERDFRGPINAGNALRFSRNIPAIKLAAQLRSPSLYEFFQQAGISRLLPEKDYGLSLVLGGAEVTARELLALYAMLANGGQLRSLQFQTTLPQAENRKTLLSPAASFMVLDILSHTPHPLRSEDEGTIAWKTGTSNGFHDAWTAGVFGPYALVVWVGNFSGKSNPSLVGVRSAAPLFFAMADVLRPEGRSFPPIARRAKNLPVRQVPVCATTGELDLTGCSSIGQSWFIPGVSPLRGFAIIRSVLINQQTGLRACHAVAGVTAYRSIEIWPSDLRQTLQQAGVARASLPPYEPGCEAEAGMTETGQGHAPSIISPQTNVVYQTRYYQDGSEAIMLRATADGTASTLHWFIDNRYVGHTAPEENLPWHPSPGQYRIRVVDDAGRSHSRTTSVSLTP